MLIPVNEWIAQPPDLLVVDNVNAAHGSLFCGFAGDAGRSMPSKASSSGHPLMSLSVQCKWRRAKRHSVLRTICSPCAQDSFICQGSTTSVSRQHQSLVPNSAHPRSLPVRRRSRQLRHASFEARRLNLRSCHNCSLSVRLIRQLFLLPRRAYLHHQAQ